MIARIAGRLEELSSTAAIIDTGQGLWYEVLIPSCDIGKLSQRTGHEIILHTIHHIEGDPSHGQLVPRLIGFLTETDRNFFKVFTTVKGIGVRKALRALVRPMDEIASAIQQKDAKTLVALPEIGKRTAETIIAQLHGKIDEFAASPSSNMPEAAAISDAGEEAIAVLMQLGEQRADAATLVERVLAVEPDIETPEEIIQHAYKLKAGGL